jgi:tRNA(Ile)-lysidine synthase
MRENNTQDVKTNDLVSRQIIDQFEEKVLSALKDCPSGAVFLAAVSGGADSMAMLVALFALKFSASNPLLSNFFCVHVEHGLRPEGESRGDAGFVRDFCQNNGIECSIKYIPPGKIAAYARRKGIGIEAAARFFRHRALARQAARLGENTFVLIAHTKDDMLETALMRVLRGIGPAGLAAMPAATMPAAVLPVAVLPAASTRRSRAAIFRPLLSLTRADVIAYLNAKNILWREDSTNTDEKYLRNKIRLRLVPLLNEAFPSWKTGVTSMAETQSVVSSFITNEAKTRIKWNRIAKLQCSSDEDNFFRQPQIIREEALYCGINVLTSLDAPSRGKKRIKSIKRTVIRKFCEGAVNAVDLGSVRVRREEGKILLSCIKKEFFESGVSMLIKKQ